MICFQSIKKQIKTLKVCKHNMLLQKASITPIRNVYSKVVCLFSRVSLVFYSGANRVFIKSKKTKKNKKDKKPKKDTKLKKKKDKDKKDKRQKKEHNKKDKKKMIQKIKKIKKNNKR